jgi:hypothetical protein
MPSVKQIHGADLFPFRMNICLPQLFLPEVFQVIDVLIECRQLSDQILAINARKQVDLRSICQRMACSGALFQAS